ncbi:MAG: FIST C-terminal domain-containing protein [Alphaproteobacteria bacterium]|nr:FIST C-terminal domain-containing protein [Alphaproteobacteria bacterium]MCD8520034.1 FIST C-terminal domain-containing protein [Alphaproteobacteria bacterium]MCD8569974.1 FIST C-terminal domain-containing protein [Alphaproteobacteria bacterium]
MTLISNAHFASAIAAGTDWRDTSKAVLEQLQRAPAPEGGKHTLGFVYVSDYLAQDVGSIVNLFRSVLGIDRWTGCVGIGVCGAGEEYFDKPAVAAMIGDFSAGSFCNFPPVRLEPGEAEDVIQAWKKENSPMLVLAHGDPTGVEEPSRMLQKLDDLTNGFVVGGLSTSRMKYAQVCRDKKSEAVHYEGGISGIVFSDAVPVASALTQGCKPIGPARRITKAHGHIVAELEDDVATKIFERDMHAMVMTRLGRDPNEILLDTLPGEELENLPEDLQGLFKGEIHVALPVSESDQADYLVRNIIGMDDEEGTISVSEPVAVGERMLFVYRDDETVRAELSRMLVNLRQRVEREHGIFAPKAALYVSCLARALCDFSPGGLKPEGQTGEMALVREVIGDIPMVGFYAGGEISNARLYGYTGVLTLFL